ncbi:MAG: YdcH family protein [Pyrinomonadaceae bacterium]
MDTSTMNSIREELMKSDPVFRQLATEHKKYESRLTELSTLHYPSDDEQNEEATLKKKKLAVKDQMYAMLLNQEHVDQIHH